MLKKRNSWKLIALSAAVLIGIFVVAGRSGNVENKSIQEKIKKKGLYWVAFDKGKLFLANFVMGSSSLGPIEVQIFDKDGSVKKENYGMESSFEILKDIVSGDREIVKTAKVQSCEMNRQIIDKQVEAYYYIEKRWPMDDLSDIKTNDNYFPDGIPTCPIDQTSYMLDNATHRIIGHREGVGTHTSVNEVPYFMLIKGASLDNILETYPYGMLLWKGNGRSVGLFPAYQGEEADLLIFNGKGVLERRLSYPFSYQQGSDCEGEFCWKFVNCMRALYVLRAAVEMTAADSSQNEGRYGNAKPKNISSVCMRIFPPDSCGVSQIEAMISDSCEAPGGGTWKFSSGLEANASTYKIKAVVKSEKKCAVCVTPGGVSPEKLKDCSTKFVCK
jgi:hypothetical protein